MKGSNKCNGCNAEYKHRQSLWRHKQKCKVEGRRKNTVIYPDNDMENYDGDIVLDKGKNDMNTEKNCSVKDENSYSSDEDNQDDNSLMIGMKDRLYRDNNTIKVYELHLDADKSLDEHDLLEYINVLNVPYFRGVFMKYLLPERSHPVECGIVNLGMREKFGIHWGCYVKMNETRIFFDSFGCEAPFPLEIAKYLKTEEEFKNNIPVIQRMQESVQRSDTKISGHLCLFVLTSLMREHFSFQQVVDQLDYGCASHYW